MPLEYTYVPIAQITILSYSDHQTDIMIEFALKLDAICLYIWTIPPITILGDTDHQMGIMIEFELKFDANNFSATAGPQWNQSVPSATLSEYALKWLQSLLQLGHIVTPGNSSTWPLASGLDHPSAHLWPTSDHPNLGWDPNPALDHLWPALDHPSEPCIRPKPSIRPVGPSMTARRPICDPPIGPSAGIGPSVTGIALPVGPYVMCTVPL